MIWVYAKKPVGLTDRIGKAEYFPICFSKQMVEQEIPLEVPDDDFVNGKIAERLIFKYPDQSKAKAVYAAYVKKADEAALKAFEIQDLLTKAVAAIASTTAKESRKAIEKELAKLKDAVADDHSKMKAARQAVQDEKDKKPGSKKKEKEAVPEAEPEKEAAHTTGRRRNEE